MADSSAILFVGLAEGVAFRRSLGFVFLDDGLSIYRIPGELWTEFEALFGFSAEMSSIKGFPKKLQEVVSWYKTSEEANGTVEAARMRGAQSEVHNESRFS